MKRFEAYGGGTGVVPGNGWRLGSFAIRGSGEEGTAWTRRLGDGDGEECEENVRRRSSIPMRDLTRRSEEGSAETPGAEGSTSAGMNARSVVWDDEEYTDVAEDIDARRGQQTTTGGRRPRERVPIERLSNPGSSWSWFGPIRRWRLRDVSIF